MLKLIELLKCKS